MIAKTIVVAGAVLALGPFAPLDPGLARAFVYFTGDAPLDRVNITAP